ncbi:MAG: HDIG domain-containing protein [Clostridia bacterium]|nr:HDIG domain-containing protein [Clostridia bacterium]
MKSTGTRSARGYLFGSLLLLLVFACNAVVLLLVFKPVYYDVEAGQVATENIIAQNDAVDYASTDIARQAARDAVEPILRVDDELIEEQLERISEAVDRFDSFMIAAREIWDRNAIILGESRVRADIPWTTMITEENMQAMLNTYTLAEYLDSSIAFLILDEYLPIGIEREPGENPAVYILRDALLEEAREQMESGLDEDELQEAAIAIRNALPDSIPQIVRSELALNICLDYLEPTWTEDLQATEEARVAAASLVPVVRISQNEILVEAGEVITESDIATLTSLNLIRTHDDDTAVYIGMCLYAICLYACIWMFLVFFNREVFTSFKTMLSVSLIMILSQLVCFAAVHAETRIAPVLLVPLLLASLHDRKTAMSMNVLFGLSTAVIMGADYGTLFNEQALVWACASIIMGQFAITLRERDRRRSGVLLAGLVSGAIGGLIPVARHIILGDSFLTAFISFGFVFAGAVIATVLTLGLTVVFEMLFDLPTDARLNELLNTNHALLKRMMAAAPGTYHHCMMCAQLAENAAEAVGANALLAKVAATYHDVGKLKRPHMFSENQGNAPNPHDSLPPIESAKIILAHQQDAEAVLQKFRLPAAVRRIVREHHGNTLVAYFYNLAQRQQPNKKVSEALYRYDAPRPSSVESAIVMMSDSCEAAVRSLNNPTKEEVTLMVRKVIRGKLDDGQFNECDISLGQISRIEESIVKTIFGIMHDRIAYPEVQGD